MTELQETSNLLEEAIAALRLLDEPRPDDLTPPQIIAWTDGRFWLAQKAARAVLDRVEGVNP